MEQKETKKRVMTFFKIFGAVVGGIALVILLAFGFGYLVKVLWNWLMPSLFGLKTITYWQGVGLIILAKLFFGMNMKGHSGKSSKKKHWKGCEGDFDDKKSWGKWKCYNEYWKAEGKDAFEKFIDGKKMNNEEKS